MNMESLKGLYEGTFVKITGMKVKNDNDIFVVDSDYRIKDKYAICKDERCLHKVKLNGEQKTSGYNIVFLNEKTLRRNPEIKVEIVTDLKQAKKEVNDWLKGIRNEEMVVSYEKSENQTITKDCYIRFVKGLKFGFFGDKYIREDSIFKVGECEKTLYIKRIGKQGQELSSLDSSNTYNFSENLYKRAMEENYIEVVEKIETKKGDIINTKVINNKKNYEHEEVEEINNIEVAAEPVNNITANENITIETIEEVNNISVQVSFNEEKNGIELKFTDKPSTEILSQIKANGFRWSKYQKIWYCKDSKEKRDFLTSIGLLKSSTDTEETSNTIVELKEVKQIEYPEIDINDIENYIIDEKLSKAENDISMFRRNDRNHTQEIQSLFTNANNNVLELIEKGCNKYIEYRAKEYLQRFKKKYYDLQVRILRHRVSNPSWAVTGRGNLNVNRYNKKQSQYEKMMLELGQLVEDFNNKIESFENQIDKEQRQERLKNVQSVLENIRDNENFEKVKVNINPNASDNIFNVLSNSVEVQAYKLESYYIIKNWGYWRVYNSAGKEIEVLGRCHKSLIEAKKTCLYAIQEGMSSVI